jgi:hypothetical protein
MKKVQRPARTFSRSAIFYDKICKSVNFFVIFCVYMVGRWNTPHTQKEEIWMKRKSLRTLVCALLASLALTTFAFADNGPKPQLIVRVKNAPQEPYYLDLLAKGDWDAEDGNRIDGIDWNYDGKEDTLDPDLLALLRDNVPAGWHACVAQGTTGAPMWGELYAEGTDASGNALHWFGYVGVPSTYRIILVTESGKVWVSDILNRRVLQSSVTVNWSDDTSAVTVSVPSTIPGYLLQFVATLVPTLLIEGALLLLFRYSWKKNWETFLLVNVLTQGFLAVASVYVTAHNGVSAWYLFFFLLPAELIILLVELYLYAGCGLLTGHSKGRAAAYAITANLASAVLGYYLAVPVWRLVVSIL